jgi:hypothetical protein
VVFLFVLVGTVAVGSDSSGGSGAVGGSEAEGASFAELASLCPGWRVLAGWRVEALAFVVEGVTGDEPGVVPGLDRCGGHAEQGGYLGQGEHAGGAESLFAVAQLVVGADAHDHQAVEGASLAADHAAGVEDVGDLGVGVVVEQFIDRRDDLRGGLAELPGRLGHREAQGVVLSAGQADVRGDGVAGSGRRDVGEQ